MRNADQKEQLSAGYERLEPRHLLATDFGLNFTASTYLTNSNVVNPNMVGDIGTTHAIEAIADKIKIFDRFSGTTILDTTQTQFFISIGGTVNNGSQVVNSQVLFDKLLSRWVIVGEGTAANGNYLHVAISTTASASMANGNWKTLRFVGDSVGVRHNGSLSVGMDWDALLITTRNPNAGPGFPLSVSVYTVPKANLYQANPTLTNMSRFENLNPAVYGDFIRAASSFEASDGKATFIGNLSGGIETSRFDVVGVAAAGATISVPQKIRFNFNPFFPTHNIGSPIFAGTPGSPGGAVLDGSRQASLLNPPVYITNVDVNIYANAIDVNGGLWFVQTVNMDWGNDDSSAFIYYEVSKEGYVSAGPTPNFGGPPNGPLATVASNNRLQAGLITMPTGDARGPDPWQWDLFNPSIDINRHGVVNINYSISSEEYEVAPTAASSTGVTVNGLSQYDPVFDTIFWVERNTQFDIPVFVQNGLAVYENNGTAYSSWSNQASTKFDPLDVNNFWANVQWANTVNRWSTQFVELSPNRLTVTVTANDLNNVITIRRHAADTSLLELHMDGKITDLLPYSVVGTVVINGFTGADTYVIDYTNGDPIPEDGLVIDGMAGPDVIRLNDPNKIGGRFVVDQDSGGTYNEKTIFRNIEELQGGAGPDTFTVTDRLDPTGQFIESSGFLAGSLVGNAGDDLFHFGSKNGTIQQSTGAARIGDSVLGGTGSGLPGEKNTLSFETRMADTFLQLLGYGSNLGYEGRSVNPQGNLFGPIGGDQPSDRFFDINFIMGSLTHFDGISQAGVGIFNAQTQVLVDDAASTYTSTSGGVTRTFGFFEVNAVGGSSFVDTFVGIRNSVSQLQLNGFGADDLYYFSSDGIGLTGNTNALNGLLFAQGGTGNNKMYVSNRGSTSGVSDGLILNNRISGIGEIAYNAIGGTFSLEVWVTEFADHVDLHSFFQTNTLNLYLLGGDDRVSIQDLSKAVINVHGGMGNDVYAIEKIQNIDLRNLSLIDLATPDSLRDRVTLVGTLLDETFTITNTTFVDLNVVYVNIDLYGVEAREGDDTINVLSSDFELFIMGEEGDDVFNFGNFGSVSAITKRVTVDGGDGRNRLNMNDQNAAAAKNVKVLNDRIIGMLQDTLFYDASGSFSILGGVGGIHLIGSNFDDVYDLMSLDPENSIRVESLIGKDTLTVRAPVFGAVHLDGGEGTDIYSISFSGFDAGTITILDTGVAGNDRLTVFGTTSADEIKVFSNLIRREVNMVVKESIKIESSMNSTEIYAREGMDTITVNGGTSPNFRVYGQEGNDNIDIANTTNITGLYITGNDGRDVFRLIGTLASTYTQIYGGNDDDTATVFEGALGNVLVNGQEGDDRATVYIANSGSSRHVDARDGGVGGSDLLTVHGNDLANQFVVNTTTVKSNTQTVVFSPASERLTISTKGDNDVIDFFGSTAGTTRVNGELGNDKMNVYSTILAAQLTLNGGEGNDIFTLRKTTAGSRVTVAGDNGDDSFNVGSDLNDDNGALDHIQGVVSIIGGNNTVGGQDRLYVNDHGSGAAYSYFMNQRYLGSIPGPQNIARPLFAGIVYDSTLELSRVDGTVYANFFSVVASPNTIFYIDGNAPSPSAIFGDTIFLQSTPGDGHLLHITSPSLGSGYWDFTNGNKDVRFENIETPYAPTGVLPGAQGYRGAAWSGNSGGNQPQFMRMQSTGNSYGQSGFRSGQDSGRLFGAIDLDESDEIATSWSNTDASKRPLAQDSDLAFAGSFDLDG